MSSLCCAAQHWQSMKRRCCNALVLDQMVPRERDAGWHHTLQCSRSGEEALGCAPLSSISKRVLQGRGKNKGHLSGPKKPWQPQTWQDLTRFSPLDFSLLSPDFRGLVLLNYTENLEKKQKIQWRRRPEIADFCPLSWSNVSWICGTKSQPEVGDRKGTTSKVPEGHHPRGTTLREALRGHICLSEGSAGGSARGLCGALRGSAGSSEVFRG